MPGKDHSKKASKRAHERKFRLVGAPVLENHGADEDGSQQVSYLQPFIAFNDRKRPEVLKQKQDNMFAPIGNLNPERLFGEGADLDDEDLDDMDLPSRDLAQCMQKKKLDDDRYIIGHDYNSEDEDGELDAEKEHYFPEDGYDYEQHLRGTTGALQRVGVELANLDLRSATTARPVWERQTKQNAGLGAASGRSGEQYHSLSGMAAEVGEVFEKKDLEALKKVELTKKRDGFGLKEDLDKKHDDSMKYMHVFRDSVDPRAQVEGEKQLERLDEVLEALDFGSDDGEYEELIPEGGDFDEYDDFLDLCGGVEEGEKVVELWGEAGKDYVDLNKAQREAAKRRAQMFGGTGADASVEGLAARMGEIEIGSSDEEEDEDEDDEEWDSEQEALYDEIDELALPEGEAEPKDRNEYALQQMLKNDEWGEETWGAPEPETVQGHVDINDLTSMLDDYLTEKEKAKEVWGLGYNTVKTKTGQNSRGLIDEYGQVQIEKRVKVKNNANVPKAGLEEIVEVVEIDEEEEIDEDEEVVEVDDAAPSTPARKETLLPSTNTSIKKKFGDFLGLDGPSSDEEEEEEEEFGLDACVPTVGPGQMLSKRGKILNTMPLPEEFVMQQEARVSSTGGKKSSSKKTKQQVQQSEADEQARLFAKPKPEEILNLVSLQEETAVPEEQDPSLMSESKLLGLLGFEIKKKAEFDCETILTTRSNVSNHPGKIELPKMKNGKIVKPNPLMACIQEGSDEEDSDDEEDEDDESDDGDDANVIELPEVEMGKT